MNEVTSLADVIGHSHRLFGPKRPALPAEATDIITYFTPMFKPDLDLRHRKNCRGTAQECCELYGHRLVQAAGQLLPQDNHDASTLGAHMHQSPILPTTQSLVISCMASP